MINTYNSFDIQNFEFSTPCKNSMGGQMVPVLYKGSKCIVQTPYVKCPFGLSELNLDSGDVKYSLPISFDGKATNQKIKDFYTMIETIDKKILETATESSIPWFGKNMSSETLNELYRPLITVSKDPSKYAPTMKLKVRMNKKQEFDFEAYDEHCNKIDHTDIKAGCQVRAIIEFAPMWFVNKTFGISAQLVQIQVKPSQKITGFAFREDSDNECDIEDDIDDI